VGTLRWAALLFVSASCDSGVRLGPGRSFGDSPDAVIDVEAAASPRESVETASLEARVSAAVRAACGRAHAHWLGSPAMKWCVNRETVGRTDMGQSEIDAAGQRCCDLAVGEKLGNDDLQKERRLRAMELFERLREEQRSKCPSEWRGTPLCGDVLETRPGAGAN
jgi:hypothetical protein